MPDPETGVAASWRDEDKNARRCEVKVYSTDVGPPGSGPEPFKSLMEAIAPKWRWVSVEFVEPGDRAPAAGSEDLHAALMRLQAAVRQALDGLQDLDRIDTADDLPSLYDVDRAVRAATDIHHTLFRQLPEADDDDDD